MPTWLIFFIVLSVLVLVHELGHFAAAIIFGIRVEEFAIGLPFTRPLFKIKTHGTQYAIYPLLFGGFVKLLGEDGPPDMKSSRGNDFWSRSLLQRILVVGAGVIMNTVLALFGFYVLYSVVGVPLSNTSKVTVADVAANTPAAKAGLKTGDRITKIEGKEVFSVDEFGTLVKSWAGVPVNLTVERGETIPLFEGIVEKNTTTSVITLVPRKNPPKDQGALGVTISDYPYVNTKKCDVSDLKCALAIAGAGIKSTRVWVGRVFDGLSMIGKSIMAGKVPQEVSGPVAIYQVTGIIAAEGFLPLIEFVAVLSVNLAVFNFLPIPALDGGRLLFFYLEGIFRKRIPAEIEQRVNSIGMVALLILMALVSLQDVWRLGVFEKFFGK